MTVTQAAPQTSPADATDRDIRGGRLAAALQEPITATARLRAERQPVSDAAAFRTLMKQLLARAQQDAVNDGFNPQDVRLAIFAVVAYLDESVLNARSPVFGDWARQPLQDELFGGHMGGEWFFQYLEQLLQRPDSAELADVLEVFQTCLLLGFRGRYAAATGTELQTIMSMVGARIARIRSITGDIAPAWKPAADQLETRDPWLGRLTRIAVGLAVLTVVTWGAFTLLLQQQRGDIREIATTSRSASDARSQ